MANAGWPVFIVCIDALAPNAFLVGQNLIYARGDVLLGVADENVQRATLAAVHVPVIVITNLYLYSSVSVQENLL